MTNFILNHPLSVLVIAVSFLSVILTAYDKLAAKLLPHHRVPEAVLLAFSVLGGSVAMYVTMQILNHKTLHKKFMIGIPVILALQLILVILYYYFR